MSDALTEFVDAEIFVEGLETPTEEKRLQDELARIDGIAESHIAHGRVDLHYNPIAVTKTEISQRIEKKGFHVTAVEAAPSSPIVDSFES